jgi:hypothetical protein
MCGSDACPGMGLYRGAQGCAVAMLAQGWGFPGTVPYGARIHHIHVGNIAEPRDVRERPVNLSMWRRVLWEWPLCTLPQ